LIEKGEKMEFEAKKLASEYLDPGLGFEKKEFFFELRKDPLTGHTSRVLPYRRRRISGSSITIDVIEESRKSCPFCPESISSSTPKFTSEVNSEGRLRRGDCILFPNSFPYASQNWVIVLSERHFIPIDGFTVKILSDGFILSQEAVRRWMGEERKGFYSSINWNYLPSAGSGIIHPHLQVVVEDFPTVSHRAVLDGLRRYWEEKRSFFWKDYISEERDRGKRYLGRFGDIHFIVAFSPRGVLGEIIILFSYREALEDLSLKDWRDFSEGLLRVFRYLKEKGVEGFNLSIFSGNSDGVKSWVYGRLCPRVMLPPWGTSDINYFEKLHGEVICVVTPEELCEELRPYFFDVD